jgi:ABC-type microcin C transport system duplicated ATPase subunit YejF
MLEIKNLKVYFRHDHMTVKAVDGIDLSIRENEVVGLVGESGSGKTVTGLSIMKLVPEGGYIEGGSITFEGGDLKSLDDSLMLDIRGKKISMIFQEPFTSLNPVFRVGEQISEAILAHSHIRKIEADREARSLLEKVQIRNPDKVFYDYPHQLSGGQRQRVMIAMALALKPRLLIADEPTTALDVTIQAEILKLLLRLKDEFKLSVLFITHDFGVINEVADRILVMKDGKIVEEGRKEDILSSPKHPYTRKLLGAIPKIELDKRLGKEGVDIFIKVDSVSKTFAIERGLWRKKVGEIRAVDGVSLDLKKGKTMGLVGESASGKTTLGRLILGLLAPDSGKILIEERELNNYLNKTPKEVRQMMQIVFQDPFSSLDPHMRMRDIVTEGPHILGKGAREKEALLKDVLGKVRLNYEDRLKFPHQFSGGQRQRIAIARALAVNPKFLVLDEPVSSLDVSIQADILKLLEELQASLGLTYLFISHDLRVVGSLADEVAVMYQGKIVEFGPKEAIYKTPKHPYTKHLLSSIPSI